MKHIFILLMLLFGIINSNAQTSSVDSAQHVTLDTLTVTAPPGPPAYRATPARIWEIRNTRIALHFDWIRKSADAREWIKLRPFLYTTDTLVLDAKGMRIDSVQLTGKKGNTNLDYTYENDQLKIRFAQAYSHTDSIELYLKYTALPYTAPTGGSNAISEDRGLYFINSDYSIPHKPAQIWTQGETESNSHWMITIDKPNSRFTTQVELTVPDSFTTLGNGALVKQWKEKDGSRTDVWRMDQPIQAYAVMFAIGKYSIVKKNWNKKEVNYYVEPEYEPYASLMFQHTPEMMDYFSEITGVPYPWNKYSQVVVHDYISGAMENTTASLFGEFMNGDAREISDRSQEDVVSHELFHMWFGDYVTCESWSNLTVNESFANYGEQLWRTNYYGKVSGDELAYNDLQGYIGGAKYNDPPLVRFYYDSREDMFDHVSYNKGGAILRYMNKLMGDDAFDKAMNSYLTKNALHSAEAHNWRLAVEEVTGQDWNWFFNEWYFRSGHPVLRVHYDYNDTVQKLFVTVTQEQSDSFIYRLPLNAAVIYDHESSVVDWNITRRTDTFTYAYKKGKRPVIVPDCYNVLPGEIKENKTPAQWLVQYKRTGDYINKKLAVAAACRLMSDSSSQALIDLALDDRMAGIRKYLMTQLKNVDIEHYHKKWTEFTIYIATNDSDKLVRAAAFEVLGEWKVTSAKKYMVKALGYSSYALAGAALDALYKIDKDTAYVVAKDLIYNEPRGGLETAVWNVIGKKAADNDIVNYEKHAQYVFNTKRFLFAASLDNYLKKVKSDESFRRGVDIYVRLIETEGLKAYKSALAAMLFQVGASEKENEKSDDKQEADAGNKRVYMVKAALERILADEKDPETLAEFKKKMKTTFE